MDRLQQALYTVLGVVTLALAGLYFAKPVLHPHQPLIASTAATNGMFDCGSSGTTDSHALKTSLASQRQYIYSLTFAGTFNQVMELREVLALAIFLNRTLIVPPLLSSYNVMEGDAFLNNIEDFFDLSAPELQPYLASWCNVQATEGWDKQFSRTICLGTTRADAHHVQEHWHHPSNGLLFPNYGNDTTTDVISEGLGDCTAGSNMVQLQDMLRDHKYVAVLTFVSGLTFNRGLGNSECTRLYRYATRYLNPSTAVLQAAHALKAAEPSLKGNNSRYIAMQIRPVPDACIEVWLNTSEGAGLPAGTCLGALQPEQIASTALQAATQHNVSTVFVMALPKLQKLIQAQFATTNLMLWVLDPSAVQRAYGRAVTAKVLASLMVEVEICTDADFYIGEGMSSIHEFTVERRQQLGKGGSQSY